MAPRTELRLAGRVVASATTQVLSSSSGSTMHIHLEPNVSHQPPWVRRFFVRELLHRAERADIDDILMIIPLQDSDVLQTIRQECSAMTARSAGSTCIVEARPRRP